MEPFIKEEELENILNLSIEDKARALDKLIQDFEKYILSVTENQELADHEKLEHIKNTALLLKEKLGLDIQ